jgi:hypothetical protein
MNNCSLPRTSALTVDGNLRISAGRQHVQLTPAAAFNFAETLIRTAARVAMREEFGAVARDSRKSRSRRDG